MGKADRISGLFWMLFAVVVCVEAYRMGLGTLRRPGPGLLFFWAGVLLASLSLILQVQAWMAKGKAVVAERHFAGRNLGKIFLVLAAAFLYVFLMEKLGFIIMTLLLFLFLLGIVEKRGWPLTILVSAAVTAGAYLLFEIALQSQLPKGFLEFLRF
jgi:putative tricarboxylic transport membrane protein